MSSNLTTEALLGTADRIADPRPRTMLPVSFGQWDRLKERIGRLGKERVEYVNWVTGAWGICVPCAISFIVYVSQTPRSQWAVALYGAATIAFAIIALILHRFQIQEREIRTEDASDIVREMTTTEEAWLRGETQQ